MHDDPFKDFDRHFAEHERSIKRTALVAGIGALIWLLFIMGAIGTVIWLLGRWLAVW
jgi:hypothetical protein